MCDCSTSVRGELAKLIGCPDDDTVGQFFIAAIAPGPRSLSAGTFDGLLNRLGDSTDLVQAAAKCRMTIRGPWQTVCNTDVDGDTHSHTKTVPTGTATSTSRVITVAAIPASLPRNNSEW